MMPECVHTYDQRNKGKQQWDERNVFAEWVIYFISESVLWEIIHILCSSLTCYNGFVKMKVHTYAAKAPMKYLDLDLNLKRVANLQIV